MNKSGSALLMVIVITAAIALCAQHFFWIDAWSSRMLMHMVNYEKQRLLVDGLVAYATAMYRQTYVGISQVHEFDVSDSVMCSILHQQRAHIRYHPLAGVVEVDVELFEDQKKVHWVRYAMSYEEDALVISSWQRLL